MNVKEITQKMKKCTPRLASLGVDVRNEALAAIKEALIANKSDIFKANKADLKRAEENGVADAVIKRLKFDDQKLRDAAEGIDTLIGLDDVIGRVTLKRQLDKGLTLKRISVPIGVLGVIFEARPDALVQIACLCIKSANAAILKGGSETRETNLILFKLIQSAACEAGLPSDALAQADSHGQIDELLGCDEYVDLIIPRGSNAFVRYIMDNTTIPVMGHSDGICHTYLDKSADFNKAYRLIRDAKLQYQSACNATETLLIDEACDYDKTEALLKGLVECGIDLRGDDETKNKFDKALISPLSDKGYEMEYLSSALSVKLVDGVSEAVDFINLHGSHHTDAIITEDDAAAHYFMQMTDSAGVYRNASTRFADGFRYGFGAEVGISTGKLHARGPVGLEGLTTYKYILEGDGHIVEDYAKGKREFDFSDL